MAVVESVVRLLVKNLGDVIIQEAFFIYGVRDQLQLMEDEFRRMQCFLKDANDKQEGDERVKKWVQDVVSIAYDAEDAIDTFIFKMALLRQGGFMGTVKRVGASSAGQSLQEWRIPSPHVQEPDLVGFKKDAETIVVWLTEGEPRLSVVSVVGMGGLGETTLVKKVYNSDRVRKHFNSHAWISISQEYAVRDLLQNIINSYMVLSEEELKKVEKMNVAQLRYKIFEHLKEKRYLLVLDDIWKNEAWDALKDALPDMNNGSRVLLTTRNKDVALHADVRSQPYEDSWELFCKKTFPGRDGGCPQDLEEVGREIVEKCHCLPLAIVVIRGLLSRKEPREWKNVRKSISWQFVKGEVEISAILSLSYKDLPYYLKPCFLYLGNFPEDREFRAKELVQMSAAEGLLPERGEETLEEVCEDCLKELIQRSIVQVARRSSNGGFKTCVIHDLLRDLSISEAKESMFLEVHHGNANAPSTSRACRLAIHHNDLSRCFQKDCNR
ncbi:putative disease resistance protein At1g50180 [Magnolia sinica]|uniref:putative disease resistance protein At1g50180 n=1 Tax=Magnolia sinica TaxID=86752 RepID=UPI00265A362E|nr:putative disease resistance protein At1g50180 [Magnolia sinica]